MVLSRRQVIAGSMGGLASFWGDWVFVSRDAVRITDQYGVLDTDARLPVVDLGGIVTNESVGRCSETVHFTLEPRGGDSRHVTQEIRPFGRKSDQAYSSLEFPDTTKTIMRGRNGTVLASDCHRLGDIPPPVPVGYAHDKSEQLSKRREAISAGMIVRRPTMIY